MAIASIREMVQLWKWSCLPLYLQVEFLSALLVVYGFELCVFVAASSEHVLHGEAAGAHGERVPAAVGLRARAGQGAARARQHHHLHLHQGGLPRRLPQ